MKKSIGKPCEGKLHARFDEGGADCFIIFVMNNSKAIRLYSTPIFDEKIYNPHRTNTFDLYSDINLVNI
jgi:hypothetical protein